MEININNLIMKRVIVLLLIIIIGFSSVAFIAVSMETEAETNIQIKSEVLNAFHGLVEASELLDTERYFEFFDKEKFTGLNADGTVWDSFSSFEPLITTGFAMIEKSLSLEFTLVKVTVINSTTAILVNEYTQALELKDGTVIKQSGGGTQVWLKSEKVWKLVSVSASDVRQ